MVEENTHCYVSGIVESGNGFRPFGKVIDYQDNVLLSITRWRIVSYEVYAPFIEGPTVITECIRVGGAHALFA
jgi:hypothetical protein